MTTAALTGLLCGTALAETHEVRMLNKGEAGSMVFEPGTLRIAAGDSVKFLATDKGHNAESIPEMMPEGAQAFTGKINEEIEVTLDTAGVYGVRCKPHYAMGMVMTIAVGDADEVPESYFEGRIPPNAKKRFEAQQEGL
jgi:pseudoazurin